MRTSCQACEKGFLPRDDAQVSASYCLTTIRPATFDRSADDVPSVQRQVDHDNRSSYHTSYRRLSRVHALQESYSLSSLSSAAYKIVMIETGVKRVIKEQWFPGSREISVVRLFPLFSRRQLFISYLFSSRKANTVCVCVYVCVSWSLSVVSSFSRVTSKIVCTILFPKDCNIRDAFQYISPSISRLFLIYFTVCSEIRPVVRFNKYTIHWHTCRISSSHEALHVPYLSSFSFFPFYDY